jgi:hypothetical protein
LPAILASESRAKTAKAETQRVSHPCARAVHNAYGNIQNSANAEKNEYPIP